MVKKVTLGYLVNLEGYSMEPSESREKVERTRFGNNEVMS